MIDDCVIERSTKEKSAVSAIEYKRSVSRSSSKQEYKECHQNEIAVVSEPLETASSQTNGHAEEQRPKPIAKERSLNSSHSRRSSAKYHHLETTQQLSAGADDRDVPKQIHNDIATQNHDDTQYQNGKSDDVEDNNVATTPRSLADRSATKSSLQSFLLHEKETCNENIAMT